MSVFHMRWTKSLLYVLTLSLHSPFRVLTLVYLHKYYFLPIQTLRIVLLALLLAWRWMFARCASQECHNKLISNRDKPAVPKYIAAIAREFCARKPVKPHELWESRSWVVVAYRSLVVSSFRTYIYVYVSIFPLRSHFLEFRVYVSLCKCI